jgi:hypothetical protein
MAVSPKITSLAVAFAKEWENATFEKRESQVFLRDFFNVFGITVVPSEHLEYAVNVGYIDCLIKAKIAVEMKSKGENLDKAFEQLKEYVQCLPEEYVPQILMDCDFETIILNFGKKRVGFKTKELRKHLDLFSCLLEGDEDPKLRERMEASVKAAEKMAKLHDALKACGYEGHDLESVVPKDKLSYILGNPPFVGARIMSSEQKDDILRIWGSKFKGVGNLDYVTAWYKKAVDYIRAANIRCAFVSTNSITQGEQAALKNLIVLKKRKSIL